MVPKAGDGDKVPDRQIWFPVQQAKYGCVVEKSAPGSHGNQRSPWLQPPVLTNPAQRVEIRSAWNAAKLLATFWWVASLQKKFTKKFVDPQRKLQSVVAHFNSALVAIRACLLAPTCFHPSTETKIGTIKCYTWSSPLPSTRSWNRSTSKVTSGIHNYSSRDRQVQFYFWKWC